MWNPEKHLSNLSVQVKQEEVGAIYLFCVKKYKNSLAPVSCGQAVLSPDQPPASPAPANHIST